MPDPNSVSSGNSGGNVNLQNAPGADFNFDDLFPNPEVTPAQSQAANQGTPPPTTPQATETQPFLKAGSSVYLTAEEAARGLEHKDALVDRYRAFLAEQGFDPNELRPKAPPQAAQPVQDPKDSYDGLFDELAAAVRNNDKVAYGRIQKKYQQEVAQDVVQNYLAPYAPLMAETARQRAIREVSKEIPDFPSFMGSEAFRRVSDTIPIYKDMLQLGENNPEASKRLPEVYKSMYLISQGLSKQASNSPQALTTPPVNTTPTARPQTTLSPSSLTPPPPGVDTQRWAQSTGSGRTLNTEARKQLIKDYEARGYDTMKWDVVGS